MELKEATRRITLIHRAAARARILHGYRAIPTLLSGGIALTACAIQAFWIGDDAGACLILWTAAAVVSLGVVATEMIVRCRRSSSPLERDMTVGAAEQFLPTLAAGALLTLVLWQFAPDQLWMLPGLWAIMLSLGIFAARRVLPGPVTVVGAHYLLSGLTCLAFGRDLPIFPAWTMAVTFGAGQFLAAGVLYWSLERRDPA